MIRSHRSGTTLALAGLALLGACAAQGQGLTPVFLTAVTSGSTTTFTYRVELLDNTTVQVSPTSYLTFFDFNGLTGTPTFSPVASGANFTVGTPLTGTALPNSAQTDNPTIKNVDLIYSGSTIANNTGTSINLGTVSIVSTQGLNTAGQFTAFGVGATNNQTSPPSAATNNSFTNGPNVAPNVPEPGTWALLVGSGMTGLAVLRRRRTLSAK